MAGHDLIQGFTRLVMEEVSKKRKTILEGVEVEKQALLDEREQEFLQSAYLSVQDAVKDTLRVKNQDYSRAVLDSKTTLLKRRTDIQNEVFEKVLKRFSEFQDTPGYILWLESKINAAINRIGDEDLLIYCDCEDEPLILAILEKSKIKAQLIDSTEELQGGFILHNREKKLLMDASIKLMIEEARNDFIEYCHLSVN